MFIIKKRFCFLLAIILAFTMLYGCAAEEEKIIIIANDDNFDSQKIHNAIANIIIEQGYEGYEFTETTGSSMLNWQALVAGDNDINLETWWQNFATYEDDIANGDVVELGIVVEDGKQGLYVPRYMIEGDPERGIEPITPNLRTVKDLADYADVFEDPEDPDKGRIYGAIPGWVINEAITNKFYAYGLDENFNLFHAGSEAVLFASLESAYNLGEPWVGYCYEPTWIVGKLDVVKLEDDPFNPDTMMQGLGDIGTQTLTVSVTDSFLEKAPDLIDFLSKFETGSAGISEALAYMQSSGADHNETAEWFLTENDHLLDEWLEPQAAENVREYLTGGDVSTTAAYRRFIDFPEAIQLDMGSGIDNFVREFARENEAALDAVRDVTSAIINFVTNILAHIPWYVMIALITYLGKRATGKLRDGAMFGFMLFLIGLFGLWSPMLETLSIVIVSVTVAILLGFPLGIIVAMSARMNAIVRPILDFMQTIPSFVYLLPGAMLLGVGKTPAVFATVIYSLVPMVRMTSHGIRYVDKEVMEATRSFGATRMQGLVKVQIPQALPTIMTGVNQTIMMAMAMVVTCALIGADGLGMQILVATNRVAMGEALPPGLAIVFMAIILDRLTQGLAKKKKEG